MAKFGGRSVRSSAAVVVAAALVVAPALASPALGAPAVVVPSRIDPISPGAVGSRAGASPPLTPAQARDALEKMPLRFEPNRGQADPAVRFLVRGPGYTLFLTRTEAVMTLSSPAAGPEGATAGEAEAPSTQVVRMALPGAGAAPKLEGTKRLPGVSHYLIGNDPSAWRRNIPAYAGVRYRGVQPGIDLLFYGGAKGLEYDFVVAPGADPSLATLAFTGAEPTVESGGDLVLRAGPAEVRQAKPVVYQKIGGERRKVPGAFALQGQGKVGFSVGAYDPAKPLVIDPVITYSSYLGGSSGGSSVGVGVAADPTTVGLAYVTGVSFATNFPVAGVPYDATANGRSDRFVSKFNTNSSGVPSLVWSTFLGGTRYDDADGALSFNNFNTEARGVAVDTTGAVYIAGQTVSADFPTAGTVTAHDATCGTDGTCNATNETYADGASTIASTTYTSATAEFLSPSDVGRTITGTNILPGTTIAAVTNQTTIALSQAATGTGTGLNFTVQGRGPNPDAFMAKLSSSGSTLVYGSYLGGGRGEAARGIAVSGTTAYVVGDTRSANLTTTATPLDATCGSDATCDATNVTNSDSPDGVSTSGLTTYTSASGSFGSSDIGKTITGTNIPADTTIAAVTNRQTITLSQPANASGTLLTYTVVKANPGFDAFVATFNTTTGALAYSTYLGGAGKDNAQGVAVDGSGRAHVAGVTASSDFPMAGAPLDNSLNGSDAFVARLDPAVSGSGALSYSTFLGGGSDDDVKAVAIDAAGKTHVTGSTSSTDFPATPGAYDTTANGTKDVFVAKLDAGAAGAASLVYATYLGGSGEDAGSGIAVTGSPSTTTVVGTTTSPTTGTASFPSVRPLSINGSSFIANLSSTGASLVYSTRFAPVTYAVALDTAGNPYLTGWTGAGLPVTTTTAYQPNKQSTGAAVDAFLTRIDPVTDALLVTDSTPKGGPPSGGTTVTIAGSLAGATAVNFGTTAITTTPCPTNPTSAGCFTQDSASQITAVSPACAGFPGPCATPTVNITVTNAQGTSATTANATFTYGEGLFSPTTGASAKGVPLQNGKILQPAANPTPSKLYDPVTGTTANTGTCPASCIAVGQTVVLTDGRVLMMGGFGPCNQCNPQAVAIAHLYDPATGQWSQTGSMITARAETQATLLTVNCGSNCGRVLVVGGCTEACDNLGSAGVTDTGELYNPATGTWAAVSNNTGTALFRNHTATLLDGPACTVAAPPPSYCGKVLVAGGYVSDIDWTAMDEARLYDPVGNDFEAAGTGPGGKLVRARGAHTATLLNGPDCTDGTAPAWCGTVLLAGGYAQGIGILEPTSEIYDPAASANSRFVTTGSMTTARGVHAATALPSGKVLVAGGSGVRTAELYAPGTGTWSSAGGVGPNDILSSPIVLGRAGAASVACRPHCGKVLFAGGSGGFLYTPLPVITVIDRSSDCTTGGAAITITGTGLSTVTKAAFGSTNATRLLPDTANPDTRLIAVTAPGSAGPANLTLTSPAGVSAATTFSYTAPAAAPCAPQSPVGNARNGATNVAWSAASGSPGSYTVTPEDPKPRFTDGVTLNGSTAFFSASAAFAAADVGSVITGPAGLVGGRTIASVQSPTQVTLSSAATAAGAGQSFTLSARGDTTFALGSSTSGSATYTVAQPNGADEVNFTSADVGKRITGTNILANTTISAVVNANTVTLSQNATGTGSNLSFTIRNRGYLAATANTLTCPCGTLDSTFSPLTNTLTNATRMPYIFRVTATGVGTGPPAAVSTFPQITLGSFTPLTPARILNTRTTNKAGLCPTTLAACVAIGPAGTLTLQVSGQGLVPSSGVSAVVMNVTAINPTAASFLTVWPSDATRPTASNLNVSANQAPVPNLVTVKLGADGLGRVNIFNNAGTVDVTADVVGWYSDNTTAANAGARFNPLTPARVLNTRTVNKTGLCPTTQAACVAIGPAGTLTLQVSGRGGVPSAGVSAVVMNVTAINPTAASFLTVWPSDAARPTASNLNVSANQAPVPNLVTVKLGTDGLGRVNIFNNAGTVDVTADVVGWYGTAGEIAGSRLTPLTPARILNTRTTNKTGLCPTTLAACVAIGPAGTLTLQVSGQGLVPSSGATAVIMNTTAINPTGASFLTVWPSDATRPTASNLNVSANQAPVPNLVTVKLGSDGLGRVNIFNNAGTVDVTADVVGWFNNGGS